MIHSKAVTIAPVFAALTVLAVLQAAQEAPGRTGTSSIRGRITDRESGEPVARAVVRLRFLGPGTEQRQVTADIEGRYEFIALPPGGYALVAEPPANSTVYVSRRYGKPPSLDPRSDTLSSVALRDAEALSLDIALPRALSIEGRVVGDDGEPQAQMFVVTVPAAVPGALVGSRQRTDSRGAFRFAGLRPGDYRVCADPEQSLMRTVPPPIDGQSPLRTCYPSAVVESSSTVITLSNADVGGVDIRVRRGRMFSIRGTALDSSGAPLAGTVRLVRNTVSTQVEVDISTGTFATPPLPPGDYGIRAEIGGPGSPQDAREREVGFTSVRVDGSDVAGLVVRAAKTVAISGRIEFEGGVPASRPIVNVNTRPLAGTGIASAAPMRATRVGQGLTFRLEGLLGPQVIQAFGSMRPWVVKAIRYKGRDVFGTATEFTAGTDPNDLVVVLTSKPATVSGHVDLDGTGDDWNTTVVLLPVDPANRYEPLSGSVVTVATAMDGTFNLPPVRAGEYVIVAAREGDVPGWISMTLPGQLTRLAKAATRIVLSENEVRSIELKRVKPW